jgi:hypothetical protein
VKSFSADLSEKGLPVSSEITMRLETPVVYFHLPPGSKPIQLSFSAEFHGGLLTQFYPEAATNIPINSLPKVAGDSLGTLAWNNLNVGTNAAGPKTESHVWLAPRKVEAANITAQNGQSERYLFYRGVGHLDSPMKMIRDGEQLHLQIDSGAVDPTQIKSIWYFDLREDGKCAYRKLDRDRATPATFADSDYQDNSLATLRGEMKTSLIDAGLFDDEADAMLSTWEESYFKSPGTRVFFLVPRAWTDHVLPIKISTDAKIERVMMGRIDLVTPRHRAILAKILALPKEKQNTFDAMSLVDQLGRFGRAMLADVQRPGTRNPAR